MRKDYFNDPDAPKANAVVPSVTAVVVADGCLLLVHRADNDLWALPGGGNDVGESIEDTVVREVKEETGMDVQVTGLLATAAPLGPARLADRLERDWDAHLDIERELQAHPELADIGKQLLATGRRAAAGAGERDPRGPEAGG